MRPGAGSFAGTLSNFVAEEQKKPMESLGDSYSHPRVQQPIPPSPKSIFEMKGDAGRNVRREGIYLKSDPDDDRSK